MGDAETIYSDEDALLAGNAIIQHYLVGSVAIGLQDNPTKVTTSLGSGTLVDFAGVRGILTAAHVVDAIRSEDEVGILRFGKGQDRQGLRVSVSHLDWVTIGGESYGDRGPDIAFIKLPRDIEDWIAATNGFFSPQAHDAELSERGAGYGEPQVRFDVGVLGEATTQVKTEDGWYGASFRVLPAIGEFEDQIDDDGFDRFTFRVAYAPDAIPPSSYGGMSGRSVWQVMDAIPPLDRLLLGVLYRQSDADDQGNRLLIGHGPTTIYELLWPRISERWGKGIPE